MTAPLQPETLDDLVEAVRSTPRLLPVGAGTKPRLAAASEVLLSTRQLRGMVEYDPAEFTFTARAGTPLRDLQEALAREGQYLPFDPPLAHAGATLGGTVAAGLSGPGRLRYGGLRDFILGARIVDGRGRLLRLGGKVVKNAAGFDVPKFLVGSLGRFGVLAELTFKVFPRPADTLSARIPTTGFAEALDRVSRLLRSRVEPDALEILPGGTAVGARLRGPRDALPALAKEWLDGTGAEILDDAGGFWDDLLEFRWAHTGGLLLRIPLSPTQALPFANGVETIPDVRLQLGAAANVAYLSLPDSASLPLLTRPLEALGLSGLTLWGDAPLWLGTRRPSAVEAAIRNVFDPDSRFSPAFD
jgi:glycolate oxidase FAD binding subunit